MKWDKAEISRGCFQRLCFQSLSTITFYYLQKLAVTTGVKCKDYVFMCAASALFKIQFDFKCRFKLELILILTSIHYAGVVL